MKIPERIDGAPKSFRIRADNVPVNGVEISEKLDVDFLNRLITEPKGIVSWRCVAGSQLDCQIEHEADMLRLKGGAVFQAVYPCVRCLEDVQFEIAVTFNARLLPRDKDPDAGNLDFETEAFDDVSANYSQGDEESVVSYFDGGIIDLSQLLREQLYLEFPLYPSCSMPEAQGSNECDSSVLESVNAPAANIIEHPFARLKNWKPHIVN